MIEYTDKIREIADRLFSEKKIEEFIGYRIGSLPFSPSPVVIKDHASVGDLYWSSTCGLNLSTYLTKRPGKIGVIANGCNSRNIVTHILEKQILRENIYIVGIPCSGVVDYRSISKKVDGREIQTYEEEGDSIIISGRGFKEKLAKKDYLRANCAICRHRNPVIYDEMVAEPVKEIENVDPYSDISHIELMEPEKKWEFFEKLIAPCIRCYACRNACPLCYCPTCFVDENKPQWVGKSIDPTDTMTFHFLRAYHCAGRCTDCGACEQVCPVNISMRQFTKKLNKDAEKLFGWEAGLATETRPPLDLFRPDDYNDFIR